MRQSWLSPAQGLSKLHSGGVHVFVEGSQISSIALPQSSADSHAWPGVGFVSKLIAEIETQSPPGTNVELAFSPTVARRITMRPLCAAITGSSGSLMRSIVSEPCVAR